MNKGKTEVLVEKIEQFISKYYKDRLLRGVLYSIALLVAAYLSVVLLEHFGQFNVGVRTFLFWTFLVLAIGVLVKFIAIPAFHILRISQTITQEKASELIGEHFGEIKDKLTNTLQLRAMRDEANELERALIEASLGARSRELEHVPFTEAIDLDQNRRYLKYALPPILIVLVLLFAAPSLLKNSTGRLLEHRTLFAPKAPFEFEIMNDKMSVAEMGDFELKIKMSGDAVPSHVYLKVGEIRVRAIRSSNTEHTHVFRKVAETLEFTLEADGFTGGPYELSTLPSPSITQFEVHLEYPLYLNMEDRSTQNVGDLSIPTGTKVSWSIHSKNTDHIQIVFGDSSVTELDLRGDLATYQDRYLSSSSYSILPSNQYMTGEAITEYRIQVIPDLYPGISVEERHDTTTTKRTYFHGIIEDDHGLKDLYFQYRSTNSSTSDSGSISPGRIRIDLPPGRTLHEIYYAWEISDLDISPGDEIVYYFEIWDNDGVNGSKSTKTPLRTYRAPSLDELIAKREEQSEKIEDDLEKSIKEAQELQREIERLNKDLLEKKDIDWQDKQRIESILNKQKDLQQQVQDIQKENRSKNLEQNEFRTPNEDLLEKQMRLEELFDELMSDEMKELYEELQKLMEEMNKDQLQEKLEEIQLSDEDIEKELDRTLEIFKQLEFEMKAEDLTQKLEELAKKQEALSEESLENRSDKKDLEQKQEELKEGFEDVKKELKELEEMNKELESPNDIPEMQKNMDQVDQEMQKSGEQLEKENNKKASESQKSASEEMEQMAMKMQSMMSSGQQQQMQEDLDALRALLENLIELSFDQEALMGELEELGTKDPKHVDVGQEQKKLKDDAKVVEDSLFALSKRIPQLSSTINKEISSVNHNMDKAVDLINESFSSNRNRPKALERQQYVMTSLNDLALLLDEAMQQMQKSMANKMPGTGNCEKPGGAGSKPSMSKMKGMQEQLSKQLEEMQKAKGKGEGKTPGSGGQGMSKQLAQMAAQQAAIRKEMQKMAQSLNEGGKGAGKGLNEVAEQMEEIEKDIVNRQIDQETLNRQKDIMVRLLESEKAEREREMDQKRRSTEAREKESDAPEKYFEYNRSKDQEAELLRTIPPALRPYYKQRVNEYFSKFGRH